MIYLFTGLPGAGKTLSAIEYISTKQELSGRPVYYWNIEGCSIDSWQEINKDQCLSWQELPRGSVIFFDEVQKLFRTRTGKDPIPYAIDQMEEHRHLGIDFIMTCQNPMQIDIALRRLVGKHYHLERAFSMGSYRKFEFQKCITDPEDKSERSQALITRGKLNSKYFDKYKSAEIHTHKKRLPKKLYLIGAFTACFAVFLVFMFMRVQSIATSGSYTEISENGSLPENNSPLTTAINHASKQKFTQEEYIDQYLPRVKAIPQSAAFYDAINQPNTIPKVSGCMVLKIGELVRCQCYSQQGTTLNLTHQICMSYYNNGWFDYTKNDDTILEENPYLPTGEPVPAVEQNDEL